MRIMDGTSRRMDCRKARDKGRQIFPVNDADAESFEEKWHRRKNEMRTKEDELRAYEEKVFVEHIVESDNLVNRR